MADDMINNAAFTTKSSSDSGGVGERRMSPRQSHRRLKEEFVKTATEIREDPTDSGAIAPEAHTGATAQESTSVPIPRAARAHLANHKRVELVCEVDMRSN